ncbi:dedicator of cytokinesis protein 3 [Eurytemora carolleeae]|uniref:dedicator of cytokinesis protein 3 n=1 Tax=Eurytemora carolleeae TaxID=1294199 RepID=UPI000C781D21|nr:dedicator of cytokinesis protein 3 [Eurytemora carolleeae]|eukprot:XP_023349268.1 dedicator of cytokinesis protein 3-like [Eurytemora affinis]
MEQDENVRMDRDEGGRRKVLVALFNSSKPEFPVCEIGDQVEGSDPQNDKKKYPWLNFFIGDTFQLLDSNQLHYIVKDSTNKIGIIQKSRVSFSNPTNPIIQEAKSTLKIWIQAYKQLYLLREVDDQNDLRRSIDELIYWSQQIISGALTKGEEVELISKLQRRIDAVNNQFDLEKVPRRMDGTRLNHKDSCVNLYNAYTRASRSSVGPTGGRGDDGNLGNQHLHSVLVEVGGQTWIEDILIYCQLYSERKGDFVSERWFVNHSRPKPGGLFLDLGGVDLCLDLHLVVLVYRVGRILNQEGTKKRDPGIRSLTQQVGCMYKRPLSGGVQSLQKFFLTERRSFNTNQPQSIQVKLLSCDERDFFHLHSLAIKNSNKLTPAQTGPSFLTFHLETLSGSAEIVLQQNMAKLKDCSLIKRLGFPPVIMPGNAFKN